MCAEVVIDVAERILALRDQVPGETSAENLSRLALLGVIRSAAEYQDVVRFRNFIVHRYESVDPAIVYEIVHRKLTVFESFGREVRVYLEAVREPEST